jgi:hypothetical protein
VFHCEESKSSIGGRIDWAHADEPPKESTWREIRGRRQRGKPFVRIISATPLEREGWAWLADEFRDCQVYASANITGLGEQFGQPKNRRAEIRSTIYDNEFLTDDDLDAFESDFSTDVFYLARIRGDYVDLAGKCPFNVNALQTVWLPRCQPPEIERLSVNAEINTESGRHIVPQSVEIEWWDKPEPDESYFIVVDPSTGIADKKHDPGGIHVWARGGKKLVARYNGYIGAWGLGSIAAILGKRYNNAMVDVEMNAGYGSSTLLAMSQAKYYRVMKDRDADKPGVYNQKLGFRTSSANRGEMIGVLQSAVVEDLLLIRSKAVIDCLLNITVDETGQVRSSRAKKGRFDEDMVCAARSAYLFHMMPAPKPRSEKKKFMERVFGQRMRPDVVRERWA